MTIYPAIDIFEAKAVRLKRGDYQQMTIYNDNPVAVAQGFEGDGATALHIVDLEGALTGIPAIEEIVKEIATATKLKIQIGGGIRSEKTIKTYLDAGVQRVILGTAAVSEPGFLHRMTDKYGAAIAVAADLKDGFVAIRGWTELSNQDAYTFGSVVEAIGVKTIICTDVSKDGMQSGCNIELYRSLRSKLPIDLIASGGVSTLDEIKTLSDIGINGAILGKALYEGTLDLKAALRAG